MRRQTFRAPGTWNNPGNVTRVKVTLVGGGGGGGVGNTAYGHGGGGGVRQGVVAVPSSPVPVTVGAGGAGGNKPGPDTANFRGSVGGTSSFGPPVAPWALIVDGGGAGGVATAPEVPLLTAPPIGGGGGSTLGPATGPFPNPYGNGGLGKQATQDFGGSMFWSLNQPFTAYALEVASELTSPLARLGVGGGGGTGRDGGSIHIALSGPHRNIGPISSPTLTNYYIAIDPNATWSVPQQQIAFSGIANTGGGGSGYYVNPFTTAAVGGSGGSGIVIVEWEE